MYIISYKFPLSSLLIINFSSNYECNQFLLMSSIRKIIFNNPYFLSLIIISLKVNCKEEYATIKITTTIIPTIYVFKGYGMREGFTQNLSLLKMTTITQKTGTPIIFSRSLRVLCKYTLILQYQQLWY